MARLGTAAKFARIKVELDKEAVRKLIQKLGDLPKEMREPLNLKEAGITERQMKANLETLVDLASKDVNMYSSPCECRSEKLRQFFLDIWGGTFSSGERK